MLPQQMELIQQRLAQTRWLINANNGQDYHHSYAIEANSGEYVVTATAGANSNYANESTSSITITVNVITSLANYLLTYPIPILKTDGNIEATPAWNTEPGAGVSYEITPSFGTENNSTLQFNKQNGTITGRMPDAGNITVVYHNRYG